MKCIVRLATHTCRRSALAHDDDHCWLGSRHRVTLFAFALLQVAQQVTAEAYRVLDDAVVELNAIEEDKKAIAGKMPTIAEQWFEEVGKKRMEAWKSSSKTNEGDAKKLRERFKVSCTLQV